jgi:uncharacterized protein (TIGR02453 family)
MLQPSTIQFLQKLKKNNNKEWFEKNRSAYELAKKDFTFFIENVINELKKKDATLQLLEAKSCIFRINRDVRFSKNKTPYKTNFGASISKGRKKVSEAGYYLHIEPGASFIACGIWMPMQEELKKIRQEIDYNLEEFNLLISAKKFKKYFNGLEKNKEYLLSRPPKGYDTDNPAIEYLKFKSYIVSKKVSDKEITNKSFIKNIVTTFETAIPLIQFLNRAIEN